MGLERFNRASRRWSLGRLSRDGAGLLVIGGGITGASVFRDAALRGLHVALLEAGDFASGTSSRSSKLVHGGLRYLSQFDVRVAWECCHERDLQLALNRRLVRPLPFLLPIYRGRSPSRGLLRVGMWAYEAVAGFPDVRRPRFLGCEETLGLAPGLPRQGLSGGVVYYDAAVDDSRWTIEHVKDGVRRGGVALSRVAVTGFVKDRGAIVGVTFRDALSGDNGAVRARVVVNAAGVCADTLRRMDDPAAAPSLHLSKGTHLVFREQDIPARVTVAFLSPLDGRPLFLIRRAGCWLYGTTDDWQETAPGEPRPGERETGYLVESLRRFLPEARLDRRSVQYAFSGFRPLLCGGSDARRPERSSREDLVLESPSGLVSVVGGKLTTARLMARRVVDRALPRLPSAGPCATHRVPLGGDAGEREESLAAWRRRSPLAPPRLRALFERFGADAAKICEEAAATPGGWEQTAFPGVIRSELSHVCRREMVCTLADLVDRRLDSLAWSPARRLELLRRGSALLGEDLGLDAAEVGVQIEQYREHVDRCAGLPYPP